MRGFSCQNKSLHVNTYNIFLMNYILTYKLCIFIKHATNTLSNYYIYIPVFFIVACIVIKYAKPICNNRRQCVLYTMKITNA